MYTKKLVSLILVVAMMLSVFAVTASAAEDEAGLFHFCPHCGSTASRADGVFYWRLSHTTTVEGCEKMSGYHSHYHYNFCRGYKCMNGGCSYFDQVVLYELDTDVDVLEICLVDDINNYY